MRHVSRFILGAIIVSVWTATAHAQSGCVFPRADQIHPAVSAVAARLDSRFAYSYTLTVLADSPKPVAQFWVAADPTDPTVTLSTPSSWWGLTSPVGYYAWAATDQIQGLAQGASLGFGLTSNAPPAVVTFIAVNYVQPPSFAEGQAPDDCQGATILENSFKGSTVGPKAPPSNRKLPRPGDRLELDFRRVERSPRCASPGSQRVRSSPS